MLAKVYYSPQGYWEGLADIKKIAEVVKFSDETAKPQLIKQALWQINLPTQCYIPCPKFNVLTCNAAHQAAFFSAT